MDEFTISNNFINELNKKEKVYTDNEQDLQIKDYSKWSPLPINLGGVTRKLVVTDGDKIKILKFARSRGEDNLCDYISEFLASRILNAIEIEAQDVNLGYYRGEECCAITMFREIPHTFSALESSTLEGENFEYDFDNLLSLSIGHKFSITKDSYLDWVYKVFCGDMIISNFDRHSNNWGFLKDDRDLYIPSPLYDNGSSLSARLVGSSEILSSSQVKDIVLNRSRCGIIYNGEKINYFDILERDSKIRNIMRPVLSKALSLDVDPYLEVIARYNPQYVTYTHQIKEILQERLRQIDRRVP